MWVHSCTHTPTKSLASAVLDVEIPRRPSHEWLHLQPVGVAVVATLDGADDRLGEATAAHDGTLHQLLAGADLDAVRVGPPQVAGGAAGRQVAGSCRTVRPGQDVGGPALADEHALAADVLDLEINHGSFRRSGPGNRSLRRDGREERKRQTQNQPDGDHQPHGSASRGRFGAEGADGTNGGHVHSPRSVVGPQLKI